MRRIILGLVIISLFGVSWTTQTSAQAGVTCPNAQVSRLNGGFVARVVPGDANNVRAQPSRQAELISQIPGGGVFNVLEGPTCADGFAWYKVDYQGQVIGWTVEGTADEYWLEPITPPATATVLPTLAPTATPQPPTVTPIAPTSEFMLTPTAITPAPTIIRVRDNPFLWVELPLVNILKVGARARFDTGGTGTVFWVAPSSSNGGFLPSEKLVTITGESVVQDEYRWWPVRTDDGEEGWLRELDDYGVLAPLCPPEHVENAEIAFYYDDPVLPSTSIYTANLDGTSVCNVTYERSARLNYLQNSAPVLLSADGSQLIVAESNPVVSDYPFLLALAADGSRTISVTPNLTILQYALSPSGDKIGLMATLPNQDYQQIWGIQTDGTGLRAITDDAVNHYSPKWSPDSTRLIYSQIAPDDNIFRLGLIGFDLSKPQMFDIGIPFIATWSPDGAKIAVYIPSEGVIRIIEADSGRTLQTSEANEALMGTGMSLYWAKNDSGLFITLRTNDGLVLQQHDTETLTLVQTIPFDECLGTGSRYPQVVRVDADRLYISDGACHLQVNLGDGTKERILLWLENVRHVEFRP